MSQSPAAGVPTAAGPAFRVAVYGSAAEYSDLVPRSGTLECVFAKPGAEPRDDAGEPAAAFFIVDLDWVGDAAGALLAALGPEPGPTVVATTREPTVEAAVDVLRRGARDYLVLPRDSRRLTAAIESAHRAWGGAAGGGAPPPEIVGTSRAMRGVRARVEEAVASPDEPVLVIGAAGAGKEHVARAIHYRSARRARPFIALACTVGTDSLIEFELFGAEGGRPGALELARGGTVFLDEVAELSPRLQERLLRALEERRFRRRGGAGDVALDARVIAGTSSDLEAGVAAGAFLAELRDRLGRTAIRLPPLEERESDAVLLAEHFLAAAARRRGRAPRGLSAAAREIVATGPWPGEVRGLREVIERAEASAGGPEIGPADLTRGRARAPTVGTGSLVIDVPDEGLSFEDYERRIVRHALERHGWNRSRAARELGISRPRLLRKIEKYGLRPEPSAGV